MSDRELLILAAKAAGIQFTMPSEDYDGYRGLAAHDGNPMNWHKWSPLTDDGDALRLAVKLEIAHGKSNTSRYAIGPDAVIYVERDDEHPDIYSATRRAIVRAAAEIGKSI